MVGFRDHRDAQRVMEVLPKRFGKYGLTIHPGKTRLVSFRVPLSAATRRDKPSERPGVITVFRHFELRDELLGQKNRTECYDSSYG